MKRYLALLIIPGLLFSLSIKAFAADTVKVKHLASAYADASAVGLKNPEGVACDDQYLYVADTGNRRLLRYVFKDGAFSTDKVMPVEAVPLLVQVNPKGEIYVLDGKERKIVKLNSAGSPVGPVTPKGVPGAGKTVLKSFKVDGSGNLYLLDIFSERVLVLDGSEAFQREIPFPKEYGFFSDLAVNTQGSVYLLDSVSGVVYQADKDAEGFSPLASTLKENVNFPNSLTLNSAGRIFVIDQYGSGLAVLERDGSFSGRKLGLGWKEGFLYYPGQVCINSKGELFVADRNNSRVQAFSLSE